MLNYIVEEKCSNWLIQLVVQCEKHTQYEEHALSIAVADPMGVL